MIFAGDTGFGGHAAYFAADIDRCYGRALLPDHAKLLGNAVRWAAGDVLPLDVEGAGYLDCCLYRQGSRTILHIVNLSGANQSPGYCEEIYPAGPLKVSAEVAGMPKQVLLKVGGGEVPFQYEGGRVAFVLERLNDHEMVVIE